MGGQGQGPENRSVGSRVKEKFLSLNRLSQAATVLALPVAVVGTLASLAALSPSPKPSPTSTTVPVVASTTSNEQPSAVDSASDGIPSADLGSWGGFVRQVNGLTERFIINLMQGSSGNTVGTFSNQTANCQGTVILNGDTTVTLNGNDVQAADLNLETTQDPNNTCTPSVEAYVASSDGKTLVYEVVTAGTLQGSFQNPLAIGDLSH